MVEVWDNAEICNQAKHDYIFLICVIIWHSAAMLIISQFSSTVCVSTGDAKTLLSSSELAAG